MRQILVLCTDENCKYCILYIYIYIYIYVNNNIVYLCEFKFEYTTKSTRSKPSKM